MRTTSQPIACSSIEPLVAPFTVIVDTREQRPFPFANIQADARDGRRPIVVPTSLRALPAGDYSLDGCAHQIAIERKSKSDLFNTLGQHRGRFERELARLNDMAASFIVVECDWSAIVEQPPARSRLNPKTVFRSVVAWQLRYPRIHWWMCVDRRFAEITTYRLLERYWKSVKKG